MEAIMIFSSKIQEIVTLEHVEEHSSVLRLAKVEREHCRRVVTPFQSLRGEMKQIFEEILLHWQKAGLQDVDRYVLDDFHGKTERPSINFTGGELENAAGAGVGLQITKVAASVAAKLQKQLKGSPSPS